MRLTSLTLCGLLACSALAMGQEFGKRKYFPLNTPLPPTGRAGAWAGSLGKANPIKFQQVQIQLPEAGQITWYEGSHDRSIIAPAPTMAGLLVGPVYRLKLSEMTDLPGVELYPTIEMIDRLHPPAGRETQFPVIIPFTMDELQAATVGRLVTKVIYLEQPNRASPVAAARGKAMPAIQVSGNENPLEVADVHGRPLAIVRLGGRVPDLNRPEPGFFGIGAPIQILKIQSPAPDVIVVPVPRPGKTEPVETPEAETPATETPAEAPSNTEAPAVEPGPATTSQPTETEPKTEVQESDVGTEPEPEAAESPVEAPAVEPSAKASDFE